MTDVNTATITIGTIATLISIPCWALFFNAIYRMIRIVNLGQNDATRRGPVVPRMANLIKEFGAHTRMVKFRTVGWAHWLVMVGFMIGFIFVFEAYGQMFNPHFHWPIVGKWPIYSFADEVLGLGTVIGGVALAIVRQLNHPRIPERLSRFSGSNFKAAYFIEAVVIVEGLGMIFVKTFKIASGIEHGPLWSEFFTHHFAKLFAGIPEWSVSAVAVIKLFSAVLWLVVVSKNITWGVAWHRLSAFFNIYFKRESNGGVALGAAKPMMSAGKVLEMDTADPDVDAFGAGKIEDFTWKGLLDFTTCTECGRCQSQCPAWNTGKPLSPKLLIMSLREHAYAKAPYLLAGGKTDMAGDEVGLVDADGNVLADKLAEIPQAARDEAARKLVGESAGTTGAVIDTETLWSCTMCGACVEQCPVDIEHVDHIIDMRRYQVLIESDFPSELAGLFKNLENKGNPWGQNTKDRVNWMNEIDIEIPVFGQDTDSFAGFEYLFWVGCAGAYEDRAKKTTKAVAELLDIAAVNFLVLGEGETCTGDSARRAGNEFLFQMLAQQNIATLDEVFATAPEQKKKIVVTCAHCFNALGNEYPQVGGKYEVVHHTQLLNRLVRDKRLIPVAAVNETVTYHDPCYLGRHNKVYEAPRELMAAAGGALTEMPRHGERSMCCGAGGARMWMEETLGKRINVDRVDEALETLATSEATTTKKIATGCPFCRVMLTDGVVAQTAGTEKEGHIEVVDVAQLILDAVKRGAPEVKRGGRFLGPSSTGTVTAKAEPAAPITPAAPVSTPAPAAIPAVSPTPAGTVPQSSGLAPTSSGLGMGGGAKRPGAKKSAPVSAPPVSGSATTESPAIENTATENTAVTPPVKSVGLGIGGGAKRPGAKKASSPAASTTAVPETPSITATPAVSTSPAVSTPEVSTPAVSTPESAPIKTVGLGMGGAAKRPGAKKAPAVATPAATTPAATTPAAAPQAVTPATETPAAEIVVASQDVSPENSEISTPAPAADSSPTLPAKGLSMGGKAKRPGSK